VRIQQVLSELHTEIFTGDYIVFLSFKSQRMPCVGTNRFIIN
jgi:hypothetical protein